jgi:hypothetical protein
VQCEALGFCVPWGTGVLVLPAEWQVVPLLPSVGNLAFLLFDWGVKALLLSGTVGRLGLHALWEGSLLEPKIAKSGALGSLHLGVWWQAPGTE